MPKLEPILLEDVDKLTDKIRELKLENTQLRVQLNRTKQHNDVLEDKGKQVEEEFEASKKRLREVEGKRVWVGGTLLGANSELDLCNKLDQAYHTIKDHEKIIKRSTTMKKEAWQYYEAQILDLRTTLKKRKDLLAQEQLEREKVYRSFLREQFQLGRTCEKIKKLKMGIHDQAYLELQNDHRYWEERCLGAEASMA